MTGADTALSVGSVGYPGLRPLGSGWAWSFCISCLLHFPLTGFILGQLSVMLQADMKHTSVAIPMGGSLPVPTTI